jgi:hypothetical protein
MSRGKCARGKLGYELRLSALIAVGTGHIAGGAPGDAVDFLAHVGTERFDCWMSAEVAVGDGRVAQGRHFKNGRNEAKNVLAINSPANGRAWCVQSLEGARMPMYLRVADRGFLVPDFLCISFILVIESRIIHSSH